MAAPRWAPGTMYQPGALVQRRTVPPVVVSAPTNADFESGATGWTLDSDFTISQFGVAYQGTWAMRFTLQTTAFAVNDNLVPVNPGQVIHAECLVQQRGHQTNSAGGGVCIEWYDSSSIFISRSTPVFAVTGGAFNQWVASGIDATAPAGAAYAAIGCLAYRTLANATQIYFDAFTWNYTYSAPPDGLLFKAVQALAGFSGTIEPIWPTTVGGQVVDNEVTWEGVLASRVIWQAAPILKSGPTEPDWPTVVGGNVPDGTIAWIATSRRVTDPKCPNSKIVMIGASKIFAADDDIIPFSATVNALDWSTPNDAGYIPFGLQTYGANPVAAMGLYRSNLVAFNATGFQMWQIDQDPASMAILDAVPVPCTYHKSLQGVMNDLAFLSSLGIRNIGIAGAATNLQAGDFGKAIDSLVVAKIKAGEVPRALYYPAQGQYWLFFGAEAFVLTINGGTKDMSWSRYVFPSAIDNWTILENDLYLRSGDLVWKVDEDALKDDMINPIEEFTVGFGTAFQFMGYDPFHSIGSIDSNQLTTHTILLAAVHTSDQNKFNLWISGIFGIQESFKSIKIYSGNFTTGATLLIELNSADAAFSSPGNISLNSVIYTGVGIYQWEMPDDLNILSDVSDFTIVMEEFISEGAGTEFEGYMAWEYLPMGSNSGLKMMHGFDLSGTGEVAVSFGYNQGDFSQATTPYVTDCESLVGPPTPMPLTAPSVQMRLTFSANQSWTWEAAIIYDKPLNGAS